VRYDNRAGKHILSAQLVLEHYALLTTATRLCLLDLNDAETSCAGQIEGLDAASATVGPDGFVYVNLTNAGIAIAQLGAAPGLSLVGELSEPGVFFEKMSVSGDRLYVAAHSAGIRVYDIANPGSPTLIGSVEEGFDDAWDIAVDGDVAYVADGAGGVKIVDLSNETAPRLLAGETPSTAAGTSQAVLVGEDHLYVAAGGAGVAVYDLDDLTSRRRYDTPVCAKNLARFGSYLAVADIGGLEVFRVESDGALQPIARETAKLRYAAGRLSLRLWNGVGAWGPDRILAADWSGLDVYELVDSSADDQPDITASTQRLHFPIEGGVQAVRIRNDGSGPLEISSVTSTEAELTAGPVGATLQPDDSLDLSIEYSGAAPASGLILVHSDDPDESPLPIQVFGETPYLDRGEPAVPFALESWIMDHATGEFVYDSFDLQAHAGQVVYFHVFSTG
jgi:hypothetical protein